MPTTPKQEKDKKTYGCHFCEKTFFSPFHVRRHERIHTGEKPYSCEICGKSFNDKGNYSKHVARHAKDEAYFIVEAVTDTDTMES